MISTVFFLPFFLFLNKLFVYITEYKHCSYVADPATFLALNIVLGTLFSSENSLFIHLSMPDTYLYFFKSPIQNYIMPL